MTAVEGEYEENNNMHSESNNEDNGNVNNSTSGEEMKGNNAPKLVEFLQKHDLIDMKKQILSSKLKLSHLREVEPSDLEHLCIDLKLNSSQKIRLKHAIKSLQKKIIRQRTKNKLKSKVIRSKISNNNINDEKMEIKSNIIDDDYNSNVRRLRSKIVIVGRAAVGKTTLQNAMMGYQFEEGSKATFAVNSIHQKQRYKYNNLELEIDYEIFDTPGLDRFADIITLYLRGALAVIVVYDICDNTSFIKAKWWCQYLEDNASGYDKIILIANKIDIGATDNGDGDDIIKKGRIYATERGIAFLEISAKNKENVNVLLSWISKQSKQKIDKYPHILQRNDNIQLHESVFKAKKKTFWQKLDNFSGSKCCAL